MDDKYAIIETKLSGAISIPTQSAEGSPPELTRFMDFHYYLEKMFPLFHERVSKETVKELSLIYKWKAKKQNGQNPAKQKPFALLAHMDVVGIEEGTEKNWKHPPFSGEDDETYIWGRGSLDDKCSLIGILEAAEQLMKEGYEPERDIYFCFGHNEEAMTGGPDSGAGSIVSLLKEGGIHFEFVLDEGGAVITDSFMGLTKPIATIGLAEKGYVDVKVTVEDSGGHSSEPPDSTAITKLSTLILNLKKINDSNIKVTDTLLGTLKTIGKNKSGIFGFVLRHPKAFFPIIKGQLLKDNQTAAMLRTTVAPTVLRAGREPNVLPQNAEVTVNLRLIAGEGRSQIEDRIRQAAGKDIKYKLDFVTYSPSLPETSSDTETYRLLSNLTEKIHGAIPLPYMVLGGTDSREYKEVTDEIYRFYPFAMTFEELATMHNTDERIRKKSFIDGVEFYRQFIKASGKADLGEYNEQR